MKLNDSTRDVLKWIAMIVPVALAAAVVVLYLLASWIPAEYAPVRMTQYRKTLVAGDQFVPHILEFGNEAQKNVPYTWSVSAGQLNTYLACVDEIADFLSPGISRSGWVYETMAAAGLAEPAAAMRDGAITLMVRECRHNKIVSVDVSLWLTDEGLLRVRLGGVRIGRLPVPRFLIDRRIERLRSSLLRQMPDPQVRVGPRRPGARFVEVSSGDLGRLMSVLIRSLDEAPVRPQLTWPIGKRRVYVQELEITDDRLTLHLAPVAD